MRYYILAITMLISTQGYAGEFSKQQCKEIFQAWVLNSMLEDACQFGGVLSYKLGVMAKSACGDILSEAEVKEYGLEVAKVFKGDYESMGKERLCEDQKPGYDATVKELYR